MKKIKFYNPYIQTLCLVIGIVGGILNIYFLFSGYLWSFYWILFSSILIFVFFLRKETSADTCKMTKEHSCLATDIIRYSLLFLLLGFLWNLIINWLWMCHLSRTLKISMENSSFQWLVYSLNILFILAIGLGSFYVVKNLGFPKRFYYSFAEFYSFVGIYDIYSNINSRFPSIILFCIPFLVMLVIGIFLFARERIKKKWRNFMSFRTDISSVANNRRTWTNTDKQ